MANCGGMGSGMGSGSASGGGDGRACGRQLGHDRDGGDSRRGYARLWAWVHTGRGD